MGSYGERILYTRNTQTRLDEPEQLDEPGSCCARASLFRRRAWSFLQVAFQGSKVRSMLMIPLSHRQQLLGYLSIFRNSVEKETLWSGEFDSDERQLYPRQSFNIWRESNKTPASEWSVEEIELASKISRQFAFAVQEYQLQTQVNKHNDNFQRAIEQQQISSRILTRMREFTSYPKHDIDNSVEKTLSMLDRILEEE